MPVREAQPADSAAIDALHRAAFGGDFEAELVERLRHDGLVLVSLVAALEEAIIGHLIFSALPVEIDRRIVAAAALAPMAVAPVRQRLGYGSSLIRSGIDVLRTRGCAAVFVLGHPSYYARFGFSAELASKFAAPFRGPAFMALELVPDALAGQGGSVTYPAAFRL
jgi:putative acetyltransferase